MRKELAKMKRVRTTFVATFERYGTKSNWNGFPEKTILLKDVMLKENNKIATDHIWFRMTKGFEKLGDLKQGNTIRFDARVNDYIKGYVNNRDFTDEREIDYKLNNPTKIQKI
jgi:hypothetical protein